MNRKKVKKIIVFTVILLLAIYIVIGFNTRLQITKYSYSNLKIPSDFNNYKILLISDIECKSFGDHQEKLISAIKECTPNIIAIAGDVVDEDILDTSSIYYLFKGISEIAPVYFISGNHDIGPESLAQYEELQSYMEEFGIIDIDDNTAELSVGQSSIYLHGQKYRSNYIVDFLPYADNSLFNILMYHGSDSFNLIANYGYDLILSGHTHGGIIRLPITGGLIGNDGTFFPEYDGGIFNIGASTLISTRGLGDAFLPRFYNRPEIVLITLVSE